MAHGALVHHGHWGRFAPADTGRVQHLHPRVHLRLQLLEQIIGSGQGARQAIAHPKCQPRCQLPIFQNMKVVVETGDLIHLRQAHAHGLGQGHQMRFVQGPVGVIQSMQVLDQQITRVTIERGLAQHGMHRRHGWGIGHTALDLLARTAGAVAQMVGCAELNGFHTVCDANPIDTAKHLGTSLAMMTPPLHTGPLA
jgi:hypothetical protein